MLLNEWFGQREGDIIAMTWDSYDGGVIRIRQSKTNAKVALPVDMVPHLRERLDEERKRQRAEGRTVLPTTIIANENTGQAWGEDAFRHVVAEIRAAADAEWPGLLDGLWFMHLRHTSVVRLLEAECDFLLIRHITGHKPKAIETIANHYNVHTETLASLAFQKRLDAEKDTAE